MSSSLQTFDQLKADISVFVSPAFSLKVQNQESQSSALETLKAVKMLIKKVEAQRLVLVRPLKEEAKTIDDYANGVSEPLEKVEKYLKSELIGWEHHLEKHRQEALRVAEEKRKKEAAELVAKIAAEREEAEAIALFARPAEAQKEIARIDAIEERTTKEVAVAHAKEVRSIEANRVSGVTRPWTFEVEDSSQVPREFFVVDEKKIREFVRAGGRELSGVRIFQGINYAVR